MVDSPGNPMDSDSQWPEWPIFKLAEIGDPDARGFDVGDDEWPFQGFVVRRKGKVSVFANICPHRRHPLDMLPDTFLVDNASALRCASHGALFDPESGLCIFGPCLNQSLLALKFRCDADGRLWVRAPGSRRDIE